MHPLPAFLVALALAASPNLPTLVFVGEGYTLSITEAECQEPLLKWQMEAAGLDQVKAGSVLVEAVVYAACWAPLDESTIFIIDEVGDAGSMPRANFKPKAISL